MNAPLTYRWSGDAMEPLPQCQRKANEHFIVGQTYRLVEHEDRSQSSHNHEFAWLHEAWLNLPETLAPLYPSEEHLRKRALIQAGYFTETAIDAGSHAAAERVAAGVRALDEFCIVIVQGPMALVRRAKSQSRRAMGKKEFQDSKQAIMDLISDLIGSPLSLEKNVEAA